MGRPLTTTLPDSSSVNYLYDSTRLQTVHRMDARGNIAYTHTYSEYAPGGLLLNEKYAGNVGEGNYTYDVLGRVESYECDHLHESIEGYDKGGNILARTLDKTFFMRSCLVNCARQDSNLKPLASEANALSIELRAHERYHL